MRKLLLLILDGWGINTNLKNNAIAEANPSFWNHLVQEYPFSALHCREESVGVPKGCLSNSEVGHTAIGAGRVVPQSAFAIDEAIQSKAFFDNRVFVKIQEHHTASGGALHLVGLLSNGGIHGHIDHVIALLEWAQQKKMDNVFLHLFLDGRDMPPMSALTLLKKLEPFLNDTVQIASVCGRAIAMDRSETWERTVSAYNTLLAVQPLTPLLISHAGEERFGASAMVEMSTMNVTTYIEQNYAEGVGDEFIQPARFCDAGIQDNDAVIFFNFRADRMRQMVRLFLKKAPSAIQQHIMVPKNLFLSSLTSYNDDFDAHVMPFFPKEIPKNNMGEWLSTKGLTQFRITETEKYAHVTFFFNGGQEVTFPGEERLLIPSLGLANYASHPEMSLPEVTTSLCRVLTQERFDFVVCNIANGDMVGHSGDLTAGIRAVQHVDTALSKIVSKAEACGYTVVITADHGNIEYMEHEGTPHTAHTFNDVPFLVIGQNVSLEKNGYLHQVAPTLLELMGIEKPAEMTSESLIMTK
ncbi:MAG TPA: 2,3-bisphosphoglycerate-independent phosphoglycerate mutase [Candidatus Magasanikbacteria bacterium]|nr:MAG: phosphoglycerate mutase (2,3-diphosphoglycerate-independent) [Candidatus Magasanikbacteria bacterium RIFCSPLOWO2_02_FULL_47_16]OGH79654.1 MAG: phosphoglycerate mutase (2,3-diphosphoglycerate-independent) [Candidatus Magasanikbacteria bacterium RIFCSPHIGHO2_02_FULL_48_18]HAZ28289.1 2,3-bisphosphoglycerate-independent phosphoglycerate mutase [Candidatus Magasanikbacteria bacterium]